MSHDDLVSFPSSPLVCERRCQFTPGRTTLTQRWGRLRLFENRLEFAADGRRSFVIPLDEVHSPRNFVGRGIVVYRGAQRLKFDFSYQEPGDLIDARLAAEDPFGDTGVTVDRARGSNASAAAAEWTTALTERVDSNPPTGVKVKKTYGPDERGKYMALVLAVLGLVALLIMGTIFAIVYATQPDTGKSDQPVQATTSSIPR